MNEITATSPATTIRRDGGRHAVRDHIHGNLHHAARRACPAYRQDSVVHARGWPKPSPPPRRRPKSGPNRPAAPSAAFSIARFWRGAHARARAARRGVSQHALNQIKDAGDAVPRGKATRNTLSITPLGNAWSSTLPDRPARRNSPPGHSNASTIQNTPA